MEKTEVMGTLLDGATTPETVAICEAEGTSLTTLGLAAGLGVAGSGGACGSEEHNGSVNRRMNSQSATMRSYRLLSDVAFNSFCIVLSNEASLYT